MIITDNETFYPTPREVAEKMLSHISNKELRNIEDILEPSAGDGRLIDYILEKRKNNYLYGDVTTDVIEIDNTLRNVLEGKSYTLIGKDFLSFNTDKHYDLIIMNPPFNKGAEHLVKAITLAENNGGDTRIISLLNAKTLKKPCTNVRVFLGSLLSKYNADISFETEAFKTAERCTDVEIAIVNLHVPAKEFTSFIMDDLEEATYETDTTQQQPNEIVEDNFLSQSVAYYKKECEIITRFVKEYFAIKPYITEEGVAKSIIGLTVYGNQKIERYSDINAALKKTRYKYWKWLFHKKEFVANLTSDMQNDLYNQLEVMSDYDYCMHNIQVVKDRFFKKLIDNIDNSIIELFEKLSAKNTWYVGSQNIHYYNGWKTNKAHKVNNKVIIPIDGAFAGSWSIEYLNTYHICDVLNDIEKVFNYLSAGYIESESIWSVINEANTLHQSKNIKCKYFDITLYKKGTCHIKFTNTDVLDALNIYMGRKNNWLPPSYGSVSYTDMSAEEKEVIDEFQGADEYAKVFANPSKYIFETSQMLMLPEGTN